ncbi:MAG TPA: TetR/AcrR family transcriptional regulator [Solirubrobacteraceae bacterium]|nr:TetR/AcrR family transcriptional regulator [Solirubrobacteraceae bacterium]
MDHKSQLKVFPHRGRGRAFDDEIRHRRRERLITSTIDVVEAEGYARLTVAKIVEHSYISRKTFYELFADREDCFLAAFEQIVVRAQEIATAAYAAEADWLSGMRAAVLCVLDLIDEDPGSARVCLVESLAAGRRVLEARARVLDALARAIELGRCDDELPQEQGMLISEGVAGGLAAMLHSRLLAPDSTSQTEMLGVLMAMIVLPYRGRGAALVELEAPAPSIDRPGQLRPSIAGPDSLRALRLRLTYRTIRVLIAIAEEPDASNRRISHAAGISDQGQISKLLRRLEALELIENVGVGQAKGGANAWRLTPLGARVQRATGGR